MENLDSCKVGDQVDVNIQIGNDREWREADVVDTKRVYSSRGGELSSIIQVEVVRTYYDAALSEPWYDKVNRELFLYGEYVRNRSKKEPSRLSADVLNKRDYVKTIK